MNRHRLTRMIQRHESLRLKPYDCGTGRVIQAEHGKVTIGYGRNLETNGISLKEAGDFLERDMDAAIQGTKNLFPHLDRYTEDRQLALISMTYNLGMGGVGGFTKMRRAIEADDWVAAGDEAEDSKWAQQTGGRAVELAEMLRRG